MILFKALLLLASFWLFAFGLGAALAALEENPFDNEKD